MNFRQAKAVIREGLRQADDATLARLLDDARAGKVPYQSCTMCLAGHLVGLLELLDSLVGSVAGRDYANLSRAYRVIGGPLPTERLRDPLRHRILVPMVLAELWRRNRARALDAVPEVATIAELVGGAR